MIDETDVVTYRSENAAREDLIWTAYVVLPNGEYWGVRFNGATEEIVKTKAISLWNSERAKFSKNPVGYIKKEKDFDPWANNGEKQHHFVGKVWMRHKETRDLKRVTLTEITMYEKQGYIRSGPRGK